MPLWNPWQNGGTPLLGMPMAAVLYPGKLLYAVLPYPQAARSYVLAHTIVALLGMLAMGRALGLSGTGSMISALSYAFGAPVLSLYSNVIFLVGAAWAPWGFRASSAWRHPVIVGPWSNSPSSWPCRSSAATRNRPTGPRPRASSMPGSSPSPGSGLPARRRASDSVRPDRPGDGRGAGSRWSLGRISSRRGDGPRAGGQRPVALDRVGLGLIIFVVRRSRRAGARVEGLRMWAGWRARGCSRCS